MADQRRRRKDAMADEGRSYTKQFGVCFFYNIKIVIKIYIFYIIHIWIIAI